MVTSSYCWFNNHRTIQLSNHSNIQLRAKKHLRFLLTFRAIAQGTTTGGSLFNRMVVKQKCGNSNTLKCQLMTVRQWNVNFGRCGMNWYTNCDQILWNAHFLIVPTVSAMYWCVLEATLIIHIKIKVNRIIKSTKINMIFNSKSTSEAS